MGDEEEPPASPASKDDKKDTQEKNDADDRLLSSDVVFSFGPNSSFYLKAGNMWLFSIKKASMKVVNTMNYSQLSLAAITPDEGLVAAYEDKNGSPVWLWTKDRYGAQTSQGIFNKLATHTDLSSLRQSYLTFGPGSSAFARVGYTTHYSSLPSSLQAQIDSKKETAAKTKSDRVFPLQVALGVGGAWVALWSDKSYSWNLGSQFDDLHDILNTAEEDGDKPASVALSPYKEGDYFIVRRNGFIAYSVSNLNDEASEYLSNMTNAYMQVRAQKDRITYQGMRTVGSVTKSYTIGPETKYPIDVSEMSKKKYMAGMLPQSLMQSFLNPNRTGSWGRFQLPDMQRRDVISMATAGICTATACDYAGLPRRVTVSATVGAVTGASACCWFLRKFSNDE